MQEMTKNKLQVVIMVITSGGMRLFFHLWMYSKLPTMKTLMQERKNRL